MRGGVPWPPLGCHVDTSGSRCGTRRGGAWIAVAATNSYSLRSGRHGRAALAAPARHADPPGCIRPSVRPFQSRVAPLPTVSHAGRVGMAPNFVATPPARESAQLAVRGLNRRQKDALVPRRLKCFAPAAAVHKQRIRDQVHERGKLENARVTALAMSLVKLVEIRRLDRPTPDVKRTIRERHPCRGRRQQAVHGHLLQRPQS